MSFRTKIALVAVAGLAIRLVYLLLNPRPLASDEGEYHQLAINLVTHFRYALDGGVSAYRPVGYPAFMGVVYFVFGPNPIVVKVVQAFLDSSIVLMIPSLVREAPERTRLLAAAVWAVFLPAVLYTNLLMTETLFTFLLVVCGMIYVTLKEGWTKSVLFGCAVGVATLVRPTAAFFLAALLLADLVRKQNRRQTAVQLITFLVVLSPWLVRNAVVMGEPVLTTSSGINLLIGNNPNANGSYSEDFESPEMRAMTNESRKDRLAFRMGIVYITGNPGRFVVNGAKKFAHFFSSESFVLLTQFGKSQITDRVPMAEQYAALPAVPVLVVNIAYALILICGWIGLMSSPKTPLWFFAVSLLLSFLAVHLLTFGGNRFHFPLMPFFALFSVLSLSGQIPGIRSLPVLRQSAIVLGALSVISVWSVELVIVLRS